MSYSVLSFSFSRRMPREYFKAGHYYFLLRYSQIFDLCWFHVFIQYEIKSWQPWEVYLIVTQHVGLHASLKTKSRIFRLSLVWFSALQTSKRYIFGPSLWRCYPTGNDNTRSLSFSLIFSFPKYWNKWKWQESGPNDLPPSSSPALYVHTYPTASAGCEV